MSDSSGKKERETYVSPPIPYDFGAQEPLGNPATPVGPLNPEQEAVLRSQITAAVLEIPGLSEPHHLHIRPGPDGYDIAFHCLADAKMNIADAHRLSDEAEQKIRCQAPAISQVLIHIEPEIHQ